MLKESPSKFVIIAFVLMIAIAAGIVAFYPHEVEITFDGEGTVEPSGKQKVNSLSELKIEINPNIGWKVGTVTVDGKDIEYDNSGKLTFKPDLFGFSSHNIYVEFVQSSDRLLTVEIEGKGIVNLETGYYADGSVQKLLVEPREGYVLDDIVIDGISFGTLNVLDITMDSDHSVKVIFREAIDSDILVSISVDIQVETNITAAPFGTISPSGNVKVKYGGDLTIFISLNDGYVLDDVIVNNSSKGPVTSYTIMDITESVSVSITIHDRTSFNTFTITATASSGGKITPSGTVTVDAGSDIRFTISPNAGYAISSLTVDGKTVSASTDYTFIDVNENHTIHASFRFVSPDPTPPTPSGPTPSDPVLTSIKVIVGNNAKTVYDVGDRLDTTDISVELHYNKGNPEIITSGFVCSPKELNTIGEQLIAVTYGGFEDTYKVTVNVKKGTVDVNVIEYNGIEINEPLSSFDFEISNVAPGDIHTVGLKLSGTPGTNSHAYLQLSQKTGVEANDELASEITIVAGNETRTLKDFIQADPLDLGLFTDGMEVSFSLIFNNTAGNELQNQSVSFTLTVGVAEVTGGAP